MYLCTWSLSSIKASYRCCNVSADTPPPPPPLSLPPPPPAADADDADDDDTPVASSSLAVSCLISSLSDLFSA